MSPQIASKALAVADHTETPASPESRSTAYAWARNRYLGSVALGVER